MCSRLCCGSTPGLFLWPALYAGNSYTALDGSTNRPGFCYDTALLLPEFNPMAVPMPAADSAGSSGLVASPLTTVLVFSQASGTGHSLSSCIARSTFLAIASFYPAHYKACVSGNTKIYKHDRQVLHAPAPQLVSKGLCTCYDTQTNRSRGQNNLGQCPQLSCTHLQCSRASPGPESHSGSCRADEHAAPQCFWHRPGHRPHNLQRAGRRHAEPKWCRPGHPEGMRHNHPELYCVTHCSHAFHMGTIHDAANSIRTDRHLRVTSISLPCLPRHCMC